MVYPYPEGAATANIPDCDGALKIYLESLSLSPDDTYHAYLKMKKETLEYFATCEVLRDQQEEVTTKGNLAVLNSPSDILAAAKVVIERRSAKEIAAGLTQIANSMPFEE